jgi:hypothetical protein
MKYARVRGGVIQQLAKSPGLLVARPGDVIIPVSDDAGVGEPAVEWREREPKRPTEPAPLLDPADPD